MPLKKAVVSYWNSTSNHNITDNLFVTHALYLIEILHQTTTKYPTYRQVLCCILLKFYIKPQLFRKLYRFFYVVSYWNSTSNHNSAGGQVASGLVVSYWNSTSNHNAAAGVTLEAMVVSYWNSTSNHNIEDGQFVSLPVVSYWNSTSNHNILTFRVISIMLYLIEILHQTTTCSTNNKQV